MAQILRPASDRLLGAWLPSGGGSPTELWPSLDETSPADADYIYTETDGDACEVGLSSASAPSVYTGHIVRYRVQGNGSTPFTVTLLDNSVSPPLEIDTWIEQSPPPSSEPAEFYREISASAAGAILSYSALSLRFQAGTGATPDVAYVQTQASAWDTADSGSVGVAITWGSGSNKYGFACVVWSDAATVSVAGSVSGAWTAIDSSTATNAEGRTKNIAWFRKANPAAGTETVTATFTGTANVSQITVLEFTDVDQTTPNGTPVANNIPVATGTTWDHVVTDGVAGDYFVTGCINGDPGNVGLIDLTSTGDDPLWESVETAFWNTGAIGGARAASGSSHTFSYLGDDAGSAVSGFAIKKAT